VRATKVPGSISGLEISTKPDIAALTPSSRFEDTMTFFERFDCEWGGLLGLRRDSFRSAFDFLANHRPNGHLIVETGCARQADNWLGDGQSTYLFDCFANAFEGQVLSVDIDPQACAYARSMVGPRTTVFTEDSVPFLHRLGRDLVQTDRQVDLLYLDSFDLDSANPNPSALHHLKELCSIAPALGPMSLVMVDDSSRTLHAVRAGDGYTLLHDSGIGGKALYVAQYFQQIGVPMFFEGYQCGWVIPK
jgi:hypothetical protein